MLLLYCQHWHFNSVIENYISGKLNWFALLHTVSWQWLINHHHFSQYFCIQSYRIAPYNVGSLGAILVVSTFLNSWQGSHLTAQLTFASLKAQHYMKLLCTTPNRPLSTSKFYVDFKKIFFQRSKKWHSLSFFGCFAPCRAFLWAEKLSCSVVLPPKNAQTFIGRDFLFTSLISHCLKSQLSK